MFWGFLKYDDIYKALSQTNMKHDVQEYVEDIEETEINTKKYKQGEIKESEMEKLKRM